MAETFIANPYMTDEEFEQGIGNHTKFALFLDSYTSPYGSDDVKDYLSGQKIPMAEQLMQSYPNCMFITDTQSDVSRELANVIYFPICFWDSTLNPTNGDVTVDWNNPRSKTVNHTGGQPRPCRILTNFWLAKNYPIDQLLYTNKEHSSLDLIFNIIDHSPYKNKSHLSPKKILPPRWHRPVNINDSVIRPELYDFILPQIKTKSYVSIQTDSNNFNPHSRHSEKLFQSMLGGTVTLHIGNYLGTEYIKHMGLETFDHVFDHSHLQSKDPYLMTIGGLENNKEKITDHQLIEQVWFENVSQLKHNHEMVKNRQHWQSFWSKEIALIEKSLSLTTSGGSLPFWAVNIKTQYGWDKMLSHQVDKKYL